MQDILNTALSQSDPANLLALALVWSRLRRRLDRLDQRLRREAADEG